MRRIPYIGEAPAKGGGAIPTQLEATAYFAAMTTAPSQAFKDAVNSAIYQWKKIGVWSLVLHLWLHCTETQQAGLLNMTGSTSATLSGGPAFSASKGFSGFGTTVGVNYPVTIAAGNATGMSFLAGVTSVDGNAARDLINCSGGGYTSNILGTFGLNASSVIVAGGANGSSGNGYFPLRSSNSFLIGAGHIFYYLAGYTYNVGGSASSAGDTYKTSRDAASGFDRVIAYGFVSSSATTSQRRKFLAILATLIDALGAFD